MKILYIVHSNVVGGSNKALFNILNYMKTKHEVRVVFPKILNGDSVVKDYLDKNKIKYYSPCFYDAFVYGADASLIRRFIRSVGRFYRHIKIRRLVKSIIDDYQPDIVHTNNGIIDIALNYCLKKGIPHVWHLREYQDLDFAMSIMPSKKIWMKRIHRTGNYNIAITKGIYHYFNLRDCDTYIYDGVLNLQFHNNSNCKKSNYFLFVAGGVFTPGKGLLDAIKAFAKLSRIHPLPYLYVVGAINENTYMDRCNAFIQESNLANKIKFLGIRNDVDSLMEKAIATLVPSEFEGFGFISVEAMFNNCLVIGRDSAGLKEQFDNGVKYTGHEIGMRFTSIDEMVSCMDRALNEDTTVMRCRAKRVVEDLYTIEHSCKLLDEFYHKITNKS